MRWTLLSQYYPPETGAPQGRLHSLARHLQRLGHEVQVLTAMPNYPSMRVFGSYRGKLTVREHIDGVPVRRSWIYATESRSLLSRLMNYFSFVFTSFFAGMRSGGADYLLCESPPLFLGITGVLLSRMKRAKLIFNVSDLWPRSAEALGLVRNRTTLRLAYALEAWLYRSAYLVTGQTRGIVADISSRFPALRTFWLPNGVDAEFFKSVESGAAWRTALGLEGKKVFLYAGILGHAQGLRVILEAAAELRHRHDIAFVIVGDGPLRSELEALNEKLAAGVVFMPNTPKAKLLAMVSDAYACIVPLKKLDLFKGAIPSKVFDGLAFGVPILLGVEGEAKHLFIESAGAGLFFEPEDAQQLVQCVCQISADPELRNSMGANGRDFVMEHFENSKIAAALLSQIRA